MALTPIQIQNENVTIVPKLIKLAIDNTGHIPSMIVEWVKVVVETGDIIPQKPLTLTQETMGIIFPDGFTRYNPTNGEEMSGAPNISQQEIMLFVYSTFKNLVTTDLTTDVDPDVPADELMVE